MRVDGRICDPLDVLAAVRLGWSFSELRGRYRTRLLPSPAAGPVPTLKRTDNALPVGPERGLKEQAIELESAIRTLAAQLKVDVAAHELSAQAKSATGTATDRLLV